jgi:uncharacterized protein
VSRPTLVVAGISVRALAESARQGGWEVIGLDGFGDLDTRRACAQWHAIGEPAAGAIDADRLRSALAAAARHAGVVGWVAGGGFENAPALLAAGGDELRLLGMGPSAVASVRDARRFFATLDRLGLAHPDVAFERPAHPEGWLAKRAGGCGGSHVRPAAQAGDPHEDSYYQRVQPGVPMSALFLADGRRAQRVGLTRLIAHAQGDRPYLYGGAIGPVAEPALQARVEQALQALVPAYALRGLMSLDFIAAQGVPWLLEVNPRPSASMVLYADAWPEGLVHAHIQAMQGRLPDGPPRRTGVRGSRVVYARRAGRVDTARLVELSYCHDLPAGPALLSRGEPVCSVSAAADDVDAVDALLQARCTTVARRLVAARPPASTQAREETLS